jgi:hypothetical protein
MPPNHHVAHVLRLIHYYFPWQTSVNLIIEGLTALVDVNPRPLRSKHQNEVAIK